MCVCVCVCARARELKSEVGAAHRASHDGHRPCGCRLLGEAQDAIPDEYQVKAAMAIRSDEAITTAVEDDVRWFVPICCDRDEVGDEKSSRRWRLPH